VSSLAMLHTVEEFSRQQLNWRLRLYFVTNNGGKIGDEYIIYYILLIYYLLLL